MAVDGIPEPSAARVGIKGGRADFSGEHDFADRSMLNNQCQLCKLGSDFISLLESFGRLQQLELELILKENWRK